MAEPKKYYWLKLNKNWFDKHNIKVIESMENGEKYVLFYLKLLVESISHNGELRFSKTIPYDEKMLAAITNTDIAVVKVAMNLFVEELHLIEIQDDKTIFMKQVEEMMGSESSSKTRVAAHRERKKKTEQHIPAIETHVNNKRYGGNYYKAFNRDDGKCSICGDISKLYMHHVIAYDDNNDDTLRLENLVTLCPSCHSTLHKGKSQAVMPSNDILNIIGFKLIPELVTLALHVTNGNGGVTQELRVKSLELRVKSKDINNTYCTPSGYIEDIGAVVDNFVDKFNEAFIKNIPDKDKAAIRNSIYKHKKAIEAEYITIEIFLKTVLKRMIDLASDAKKTGKPIDFPSNYFFKGCFGPDKYLWRQTRQEENMGGYHKPLMKEFEQKHSPVAGIKL